MSDYVRNYPNSLDLETFEHAGDSYTTTMRFYAHSEFSVSIVVACHGLSFVVYQKRDKKNASHSGQQWNVFNGGSPEHFAVDMGDECKRCICVLSFGHFYLRRSEFRLLR